MNTLLLILINIFRWGESTSNQVRLDKKQPSGFDKFCQDIAPYVLVAAIIILTILVLVLLIRFGGICFGTEANRFYNGDLA